MWRFRAWLDRCDPDNLRALLVIIFAALGTALLLALKFGRI